MISEIGALIDFTNFLHGKDLINIGTKDKVKTSLANLKWNCVNRLNIKRAQFEENDKKKVVNAEEMRMFYNSTYVKQQIDLLKKPRAVNVREGCGIRNYLLFNLMYMNNLRQGYIF